MNLRLVKPSLAHEAAAMELIAEFRTAGEGKAYGSSGLIEMESYEDWLLKIAATPPGHVKQTTFFSYDGESLIGTTAVRHTLNEQTAQTAGHIGYSIRPSKRRMGYAKMQFRLALGECAKLGIERALITCDKENIASAATIAAFGGVEDEPFTEKDGTITRRFWVDTRKGGE